MAGEIEVLSNGERELIVRFAKEYLIDYNPISAAFRIGLVASAAMQFAQNAVQTPLFQQTISELSYSYDVNDKNEVRRDHNLVINTLRDVAQNGKPSARALAAAKLSAIRGFDAPIKTKQDITHRGGVMRIPAIADVEEWENAAEASQRKLVEETQEEA